MIPLQRYFALSLTLLLCVPPAARGQAADYTPSNGGGTTLNIAAGKARCGSGPSPVTYAGGSLTLSSGNGVYNVYLDPASSCAPAFAHHASATPFTIGHIPIAQVTVSGSSISSVADVRTWFQPNPCAAETGSPAPVVPTAHASNNTVFNNSPDTAVSDSGTNNLILGRKSAKYSLWTNGALVWPGTLNGGGGGGLRLAADGTRTRTGKGGACPGRHGTAERAPSDRLGCHSSPGSLD